MCEEVIFFSVLPLLKHGLAHAAIFTPKVARLTIRVVGRSEPLLFTNSLKNS